MISSNSACNFLYIFIYICIVKTKQLQKTVFIFYFINYSKLILLLITDDIKLKLVNKSYVLENVNFNTQPAVIHGNGLSKITFNSYTNYIPNKWSPESGCNTCYDNNLDLSMLKVLSTINLSYKFIIDV